MINVRDQGESSSLDDDEVFNEEEYQTIALPDDGHVHKKSFIMLLAKYLLSLENDHRVTKFSLDNIAISTKQILLLSFQFQLTNSRTIWWDKRIV